MSYKEKFLKLLRRGYTPEAVGCKDELISIYNKGFKPNVDKKDLPFFIELFDSNEAVLRAWSFLGIYNIVKGSLYLDYDVKEKINNIIGKLLNDKGEINFFGGSIEIETSLREHHVRRITDLDPSLVFDPVFKYCEAFVGKTDTVIGDLLQNIIALVSDPRIENLLLKRAQNVNDNDFIVRLNIISAFEKFGQNEEIKEKPVVTDIFKNYLNDIKNDSTESAENDDNKRLIITNQKKRLRENIFRVAALLDLDLESETLAFIDSLVNPYSGLSQIAQKYKANEKFKSIILKKLEESTNPAFITDILKAIIVVKEGIKNWKNLVLDNVNKYRLIDGDLIEGMQEAEILSEPMLLSFLTDGDSWHFNFIREFLKSKPEKFDEWSDLQQEVLKILKMFKPTEEGKESPSNFKDKKGMALKLIIDLDRKEMINYCLDNFKNLEEDDLKKACLYMIIKSENNDILDELRSFMNKHPKELEFVKKFFKYLDARDGNYYY